MKFIQSVIILALSCQARVALSCQPNLIENSDQHLSCLYKHALSKYLSAAVKDYRTLVKECENCQSPFLGAKKYAHLFSKKHMAIAFSKNSFGGEDLYVVFRGNPLLYKFWFYEIEKNKLQLRSISSQGPTNPIAKTISILQRQDKFWKN